MLAPLRERVARDPHSLCLDVREHYVNLYYRVNGTSEGHACRPQVVV